MLLLGNYDDSVLKKIKLSDFQWLIYIKENYHVKENYHIKENFHIKENT